LESIVWVSKVNKVSKDSMDSMVTEIIGSNQTSVEGAAESVLSRAIRTSLGITVIEVVNKGLKVGDDAIRQYRVRSRLTFNRAMGPRTESHW
jgi:flavin-binding protein dodecin